MTVLFDGLALTRRLETGGAFTRPQAEALVDGLHDALVSSVATKSDLQEVKNELRVELKSVKAELKAEIQDVKADVAVLRAEMNGKFNLLYWMFGAIVAALAALLTQAFMH